MHQHSFYHDKTANLLAKWLSGAVLVVVFLLILFFLWTDVGLSQVFSSAMPAAGVGWGNASLVSHSCGSGDDDDDDDADD